MGRSRRIPVTYIHQALLASSSPTLDIDVPQPARIPLSIGVKRNLGVKVPQGLEGLCERCILQRQQDIYEL